MAGRTASRGPDLVRIRRSARARRMLAAGIVLGLAVGSGAAAASGSGPLPPAGAADAIEALTGQGAGDRDAERAEREARRERMRGCMGEHLRGGRENAGSGEPHSHSHRDADHSHRHGDRDGERTRAAARKHCREHIDPDPQADFTGFRGDRAAGEGRRLTSGPTAGKATLEQRVVGGDPDEGFQFLELGPGEGRVVREDLATARPNRQNRRESVLYFAQTTDWQLADGQSPARAEFLDPFASDPFPSALSGAWRPQEELVPRGVEMAVRQINHFADASPHRQGDGSRAPMDMVLMTGDQADNAQLNETEWTLGLMEGGPLSTNSGTDPSSCPPGMQPQGQTADPDRYAGVQDYEDYAAAGLHFYDPNQPAGPYADWPRYPGLMDRAQEEFMATGFKVPSYVTPGNHDGLAQGLQSIIGPFEIVGTGCVKPLIPVATLTNPDDFQATLLQVLDPAFLAQTALDDPSQVMFVPPDERRRYVDKAQYKAVFEGSSQPDAHGFAFVDPEELAASNGAASYYSWNPKPGLRMISIDTLCEGGVTGPGASGNLDDPQLQWLRGELERGQAAGELIIVFGHHPIRSLSCDLPDEAAPPCTTDDAHGHDVNPGCDRDPRISIPIRLGADLEDLFHEFPNMIAYVAGHTHEQAISKGERPDGGPGDFWGIETASLVDWPPQNRLVELMDNCDGTLSFLGTVIDTAAPATAPPSDTPADEMNVPALASVARTLAYNDPQLGPGGGGDGVREDRNVELVLDDPRPEPSECTRRAERRDPPDEPRPPDREPDPDEEEDRAPAADRVTAVAETPGRLPFTGLALLLLVAIAAAVLTGGRLLRRAAGRGPG